MNAQEAIARIEQPPMALDAAGRKVAIDDLLNKVALVQEVMQKVMHEGEHYGVIPGCGPKPALLKAGAEKLGMTFRIRPTFEITERDLGNAHREYSVKCILSDGTQGVGSCSTMESKYRYRKAERTCPNCGKDTIRQSKKDERHPNGGFYCWAKIGGCGLQFEANDDRITGQVAGKVEHDNPADYYNTCLKMGKKRAHVDAIITATACSDIFTQDVEEMVENRQAVEPVAPKTAVETASAPAPPPAQKPIEAEIVVPNVSVKMVQEKTGTRKSDGKPWRQWVILLNDGTNDREVSTFSRTVGEMAGNIGMDETAEATIRPGKIAGTWDLVSILPKPADKQTDDVPM